MPRDHLVPQSLNPIVKYRKVRLNGYADVKEFQCLLMAAVIRKEVSHELAKTLNSCCQVYLKACELENDSVALQVLQEKVNKLMKKKGKRRKRQMQRSGVPILDGGNRIQ